MRLFCFGYGYSASYVGRILLDAGWDLDVTVRSFEKAESLRRLGLGAYIYDSESNNDSDFGAIISGLENCDAVLSSLSPSGAGGDPVLSDFGGVLRGLCEVKPLWLGYLSSVGVYGDYGGGWVDEGSGLMSGTVRGLARIAAERSWLALGGHIFRLAGIYGDGRNALESVLRGKAHRVYKEGQVFSRIHVEDLAWVVRSSIENPNSGAIYNVCDDEAAPPQDVIAYACELLECRSPPLVSLECADLSAMARSFYSENRRVCNDKIKSQLGVCLRYQNYRVGLNNLFQSIELRR